MKATVRAKTRIVYHGRSGTPMLHGLHSKRAFIMVRKKGGGTKRLYLDTKLATREIQNIRTLRSEVRRRFK